MFFCSNRLLDGVELEGLEWENIRNENSDVTKQYIIEGSTAHEHLKELNEIADKAGITDKRLEDELKTVVSQEEYDKIQEEKNTDAPVKN